MLNDGCSQAEAAYRLGVTKSTVNTLVTSARGRLGKQLSSGELVVTARRQGWLGPMETPDADFELTPAHRLYLAQFHRMIVARFAVTAQDRARLRHHRESLFLERGRPVPPWRVCQLHDLAPAGHSFNDLIFEVCAEMRGDR